MARAMEQRRWYVPENPTFFLYLGKLYLSRFFGVLIGLVAVLQLLDLLAASEDILAVEGAGLDQLVHYVTLRLPQLIAQFAPFSALLGTLMMLASLNQHSEIIIMKAAGMSAHKILLPLGVVSALVGFAHLVFNESVVVSSTSELNYWEENGYAIDFPPPPDAAGRTWIQDGQTVVLVEAVNGEGERTVLDKVSLFLRDEDSNLDTLVRASFANRDDTEDGTGRKWVLWDVRQFKVRDHELTNFGRLDWDTNIPPDRFHALTVKPERVNILRLWRSMRQLEAEGENVDTLWASFWQKLAGPAASLLMPLLGAIAGFGVHRAGTLMIRVVMGMALGFSFFVADNFMLAMGEFGVAPPFLSAWAPFFLFLLVGYAVLFNTEE